jgi:LuxR family maltose regulon positive regulatory protein
LYHVHLQSFLASNISAPVVVSFADQPGHSFRRKRVVQNETTDLIRSKWMPPQPRAGQVPRAALLARLESGLDRRLTLIVAPAGFGKTTLLAQGLGVGSWGLEMAHPDSQSPTPNPRRVGWLSLDAADNDPVRFWRYVIGACQSFQPDLGRAALALLDPSRGEPFRPQPLEPALTALLNDLAGVGLEAPGVGFVASGQASSPKPQDPRHVLVLEDYHAIAEPRIHELLAFVLDHLPPTLHVILTARADPPLPLAQLRARGELSEIRAADLRFSSVETRAFLAQALAFPLPEDAIAHVEARTEGWAAGLRLAALALRGHADAAAAERALRAFGGGQQPIAEYLATAVLETLPEPLQAFLLQTSVAGSLSGPLCDAITGRDDGADTLEWMERAGLFLDRLEGSGSWYRPHALFAEALRHQARRRLPADTLRACYRRAGEWYAQHDMLAEAIDAILAAAEWERASDLLERVVVVDQVLGPGDPRRVRGWLEQLPAALLHQRPALCFGNAFVVLRAGDGPRSVLLERFEEWLEWAEAGWRRAGDAAGLGSVFAARALGALWGGRMDAAVAWARKGLAVLSAADTIWRGICLGFVGFDQVRSGMLDAARQTLLEARAHGIANGNRPATRAHTLLLADACVGQCELRHAAELYRQALADAQDDPEDGAKAHLGLARIAYEQDDLDTAAIAAQAALDLSDQAADAAWAAEAALVLARAQQARGDADGARQRLAALLARVQPLHAPAQYRAILAQQARLALATGDLAAAQRWADTRARYVARLAPRQHEEEELIVARLWIASGQAERALSLLERWHHEAQLSGRARSTLEILVLKALACAACERGAEAGRLLREALARAHAEGHRRVFLDEGAALAAPLRAALPTLRDRRLRGWAATFVRACAERLDAPPDATLSRQERRVLDLLADGRSNPEIAAELVVSVNTVKSQLKQIYRKLGVASRHEARALAADLDLI